MLLSGRPTDATQVRRRCFEAVQRCDLFFAWLTSLSAYGTLVELGWAESMRKRIVIAYPSRLRRKIQSEQWFALGSTAERYCVEHPSAALYMVLGEGVHAERL